MRTLLVVGIAAMGMFTASGAYAQAANTSSATASGSVTILRPLTVAKDTGGDLQFGRIVQPRTGSGTVTIGSGADTVSASGGAVALSGISTSRAKFTISGEGGQAVGVTIDSTFVLSNGTTADDITVTTSNNLGATSTPTTTLSNALGSAGSSALLVGGSFSVPSGASTGLYTGTLNVSVAYN